MDNFAGSYWLTTVPLESLENLSNLPRLKNLEVILPKASSLLKLLSTASGLDKLTMTFTQHCNYQSLWTLISSMKNLKSLDLNMVRNGCWNGLLQAVSSLEVLEDFKLRWNVFSQLKSTDGLIYLANGPVKRSLVNCEISATIMKNSGGPFEGLILDLCSREKLRESLLRCFNEEVEPMFEKRIVGHRKLVVRVEARTESDDYFDSDEEGEESE
mmetsp:Transcript_8253/g.20571  ORF Transcript_8253/g.20571 Transcript_8253/m.20571 type:complete len:214 (-) Transcript_8253:36-677(-)